jgi:hypothetical protein
MACGKASYLACHQSQVKSGLSSGIYAVAVNSCTLMRLLCKGFRNISKKSPNDDVWRGHIRGDWTTAGTISHERY